MNRDEFEAGYAERSGTTVEFLQEHGMFGIPCHCGDKTCDGWQMLHTGHLTDLDLILAGVHARSHAPEYPPDGLLTPPPKGALRDDSNEEEGGRT